MDIKEIFMYPTKDKEWPVKMIIGIALSILPIVNFFCSGYAYRIFKAGLNRQPLVLPEWDEWGDVFIQGLIIFAMQLLYYNGVLDLARETPACATLANVGKSDVVLKVHKVGGGFVALTVAPETTLTSCQPEVTQVTADCLANATAPCALLWRVDRLD